ncbi:FecR family protein [Emticicia sp. W12TSBA100-4]|uniref:FecR family protein n=1 Tax=Emticicia sp. W12TSBA100-4 TaxID=3160965 RepID=UPI0033056B94
MKINKEIIERFLQNTSTDQERRAVETWYYSFENNLDGISQLTDEEQLDLENELYLKIKEKIAPVQKTPTRQINWVWYLSSAAAMFLLTFGIWTYNKSAKNIQSLSGIPFSGWAKYENVSAKELKITLPDGSVVVMKPKTQLSYNQSDTKFREVNLIGEAFFDVMHDATRPFLIYTGKMTTKVLGTSFSVKAYPSMKKSEVSVVSGKVTVFEKDAEDKQNNGVILTPNLKVTFFDEEEHFVTGLVEKPEVLTTINKENLSFNFQDAPLNEVLTALEKAYGIEMVLERESLGKCTLNGDLTEMPLFTKLDIITRSLNATYQVKGTSILVSGAGCE